MEKQVKAAHKAEVTTSLKGTVIRTSEASPDMYASIDLVADRLVSAQRDETKTPLAFQFS